MTTTWPIIIQANLVNVNKKTQIRFTYQKYEYVFTLMELRETTLNLILFYPTTCNELSPGVSSPISSITATQN